MIYFKHNFVTLRLLIVCNILFFLIVKSVFASEPPITFSCKAQRVCTLDSAMMKRKKECRKVVSDGESRLIYYAPEGFWFDNELFNFDKKTITKPQPYRFAGVGEPEIIDFDQQAYGDFIYRRTIFKYEQDLTFVKSSPQQTVVFHYICRN